VYSLARAVLLIGGIVAIVLGATALGDGIATYRAPVAYTPPSLTVITGVVALAASNRTKDEAADIVLAVLGFLAGGVGGALVTAGDTWALVSKHAMKGQG
jgi:uncharacterized membrane protein HdeD (DUF308 family)